LHIAGVHHDLYLIGDDNRQNSPRKNLMTTVTYSAKPRKLETRISVFNALDVWMIVVTAGMVMFLIELIA
jgi:hypothetical protein